MPELRFEHVSKSYPNGAQALHNLSLTISHGQCLVLMGPSGCGKTTALRLAAGLEQPSAGAIFRDDQLLAQVPPWQRGVALAFQAPALLPDLTVRRQWEFTLGQRKKRGLDANGTIPDLAGLTRLLDLAEVLECRPPQLSGGQVQRVVLGKIILSGAPIWLLDEPLAHVDAPLRQKFLFDLHLLRRHFPATILYVTHDPAEARAVGDRIAVLVQGVLHQEGPPEQVHRRPAHRCVAELFQSPEDPWNFLPARQREERLEVSLGGLLLGTIPLKLQLPTQRAVLAGIRAHAVRLTPDGNGSAAGLTVDLARPVPRGNLVQARSPEGILLGRADQAPAPGEPVMATILDSEVLVVDRDTGATLALVGPDG